MANLIEEFLYLQEVNRIVQGMSRQSGKPKEHIDAIWKDTEKEVLVKHKFGVTDKYKQIGNIVRSKMGLPPQEDKDELAKKKKEPKDDE